MYINYHENETWLGVYWAYGVLIMEFPVYRSSCASKSRVHEGWYDPKKKRVLQLHEK